MDKFVKKTPRAVSESARPVVLPRIPRFAPLAAAAGSAEAEDEVKDDREAVFDEYWSAAAHVRLKHRQERKKRENAPRTLDQHWQKRPRAQAEEESAEKEKDGIVEGDLCASNHSSEL